MGLETSFINQFTLNLTQNETTKLKAGKSPIVPYKHDKIVYDYTYEVQNNTELENRTWKDKMYYRPISRDEINKNELLVQNPGY